MICDLVVARYGAVSVFCPVRCVIVVLWLLSCIVFPSFGKTKLLNWSEVSVLSVVPFSFS